MSEENARQAAEDFYYAALDLVAEGHHEQAVEHYQKALSLKPGNEEAKQGMETAWRALHGGTP